MLSLSWKQVNRWRLRQHGLIERAERGQMLDVVSRVGAIQAQMMSAAELQVWARVNNLGANDVANALWKDRTLIKTWVLRGTLHLISAQDFPVYVAALSAILLKFYKRGSWLKYNGVTMDEFEAIAKAVDATLTDTFVSRKQLAEAIATQTGNPNLQTRLESGWGVLLKPSAVQGYLIFGVSEGQNVSFVHPRHWIGEWKAVEPETAIREIARRYLNAYAPATADDFGHWFGMQPADAKRAFRSLGNAIEEVDVEGWKAWALTSTLDEMRSADMPETVRLLPHFDAYTINASSHSQYVVAEQHRARVYRAQGWISPVVLVDGQMAGVWEYARKRSTVTVRVDLFEAASKAVKQGVQAEAERLGEFLRAEAELVFGE